MRACQIQSAGACWLRASLRTAPSSRLSCGSLALTCLGITLLLPLRNTPTSYCSPFEEHSTRKEFGKRREVSLMGNRITRAARHLPAEPTGYATSERKGGERPEKLAKTAEMWLPERKLSLCRCWKGWKQGVSYGTVTPHWE